MSRRRRGRGSRYRVGTPFTGRASGAGSSSVTRAFAASEMHHCLLDLLSLWAHVLSHVQGLCTPVHIFPEASALASALAACLRAGAACMLCSKPLNVKMCVVSQAPSALRYSLTSLCAAAQHLATR